MLSIISRMIFIDTTVGEVILICITSLVGIFGVSAALEGYLMRPMTWYVRAASLIGGLLLIYPGIVTDIIGLGLVGGVVAFQYVFGKKAIAAPQLS